MPTVPRSRPVERPLTARSVLASALLGTDPPELHVSRLVRLAGLFAINENRARVALSRMVTAGEVSTDGSGRYRLQGDLLARQARQVTSRAGGSSDWDGTWWTVIITAPPAGADVRARRRTALRRARLAELREGVWLRPTNVPLDLAASSGESSTDLTDAALVLRGTPEGDGAVIAAGLWDLADWNALADDLVHRLERTPPTDASVLAPGFVLSASVLRHLQSDPLLPEPLLPHGLRDEWRGPALRDTYDRWDAAYREQLTAWHRSVV